MTYRTLAFVLCEAATFDFRGNPSLIGVLPTKVSAAGLNTQFVPTLCAIFEQETPVAVPDSALVDVTVKVTGPNNETAFFARQQAPRGQAPPNERHRMNLLMQVPMSMSDFGEYRVEATLRLPSDDAVPEETMSANCTLLIEAG